ncbi:MAG: peptide-methionine (S)-S-oxide reductase [Thermoplasmata archaeon M8B2D]|nr:MAG: peptide-methionine (S)-S-oxide reductase [Thermoplasmata archaeon M8B2D]
MEKATFGAGCFWGVQKEFNKIKGIVNTTVGYMGGNLKNPTYKDVCTNKTGHVEVVQIEFDPKIVNYEKLLELFWKIHDPTQLNRQGLDIGTQYKSIIFYHTEEQKIIAEQSKEKLRKSNKFKKPIVTEIKPSDIFYKAEEYHQNYLEKNKI